jgi:hypothetical protein
MPLLVAYNTLTLLYSIPFRNPRYVHLKLRQLNGNTLTLLGLKDEKLIFQVVAIP